MSVENKLRKSDYKSERRHFHEFPNQILVETGTYQGDGVQDALDSGFKYVISFESEPTCLELSKKRFRGQSNVTIVDDTSSNLLQYIRHIDQPMTFWLDAHWSGSSNTRDICCPVLKELDAIGKHSVKTHTILVDDVRLFGTSHFGNITISDVIAKLKTINSNYKISYRNGHVENDILVATI